MSARKIATGTANERWLLDEHETDRRCLWPTAELAAQVWSGVETSPAAIQAVASAYVHLLAHPAGTEAAVKRLRALRRAERMGP